MNKGNNLNRFFLNITGKDLEIRKEGGREEGGGGKTERSKGGKTRGRGGKQGRQNKAEKAGKKEEKKMEGRRPYMGDSAISLNIRKAK